MTKVSTISPSFTAARNTSNISSVSQWGAIILRTGRLLAKTRQRRGLFDVNRQNSTRLLAQVRSEPFSELWFTASFPARSLPVSASETALHASTDPSNPKSSKDHKPPDERTLKLGKTLRRLSPLLPNILTTPLPNDLLSSSITLHLFPSTHPHLPVVKGRVPYRAALWTAPVAWGSVPFVGNVKLEIQSEKVVRTGLISAPTMQTEDHSGLGEEKLVVRWRTERKQGQSSTGTAGSSTSLSSGTDSGGVNRGLSTLLGGSQPLLKSATSEPFTGLFIFSFDQDGKIASMTIEHADESHGCDKTSRVVTLTDWLLGRAKWGRAKEEEALVPGLAMNTGSYSRRWVWMRRVREYRDSNNG